MPSAVNRGTRCVSTVRWYTPTNGPTDGNIMAAIISAHMAVNPLLAAVDAEPDDAATTDAPRRAMSRCASQQNR
jgi:hypothetical protein